jgi:hypothetical protein
LNVWKGTVEENEEEKVQEKAGKCLLKPFVGAIHPGDYVKPCHGTKDFDPCGYLELGGTLLYA